MQFHLYECIIQRGDQVVCGHIVAPSQARAALVVIEHEKTLGLSHDDFSLDRIDEKLPRDRRLGLDTLLHSAPVGFASFCEIGWVAHTAPVQQLKLFRLVVDDTDDIYAIAPNIDVAASVFSSSLGLLTGEPRMLSIAEETTQLTDRQKHELGQLIELGPIGIVAWDEEDGWSPG